MYLLFSYLAHEAGIAEGQSSSNFSGSNNIFDFVVDTCNETVSNKKLAANPLPNGKYSGGKC